MYIRGIKPYEKNYPTCYDNDEWRLLIEARIMLLNLPQFVAKMVYNLFDLVEKNQKLWNNYLTFIKSLLAINNCLFFVKQTIIDKIDIINKLIYFMIDLVSS